MITASNSWPQDRLVADSIFTRGAMPAAGFEYKFGATARRDPRPLALVLIEAARRRHAKSLAVPTYGDDVGLQQPQRASWPTLRSGLPS
jgi:hypothetical protein